MSGFTTPPAHAVDHQMARYANARRQHDLDVSHVAITHLDDGPTELRA